MRILGSLVPFVALAVTSVSLFGCDVQVTKCSSGDECFFPEDDDSGVSKDASTLDAKVGDGGTKSDAGTSGDAQVPDAGADAAAGDGGAGSLTLLQFCEAELASVVGWRDAMDGCCNTSTLAARESLLQISFGYTGEDPAGTCSTKLEGFVKGGSLVAKPEKLAACAAAYVAQFPAVPPSACPMAGFDFEKLESQIGHGVQLLAQIPACRAALVGNVTSGNACTDPLECLDGLRCRPAAGGGKTCQPAVMGGECKANSECADGYFCVTSSGTNAKTCVPADQLIESSSSGCAISGECVTGMVCRQLAGAGSKKGCKAAVEGTFACTILP